MRLYVINDQLNIKQKQYFERVTDPSLFPIVDFVKSTIKANPLQRKLLQFGETFEEKMGIIKKYIGAIVTEDMPLGPIRTSRIPHLIPYFKVTPSLAVVDPFLHGWYSANTRKALEGAIQQYRPKIVVELGVWYGKSTVGILQAAQAVGLHIDYYGFDYFNPASRNPKHLEPDGSKGPLDKLFINHFRLETAVANVAPYTRNRSQKIHFVIYDVLQSATLLQESFDSKDLKDSSILVFIDAIKEPKELIDIIYQYLGLNPNCVIVGDDYVFPKVRYAVRTLQKDPSLHIKIFGEDAYIVTKNREIPPTFPKPVSDFSDYPHLKLSKKETNIILKNKKWKSYIEIE